MVVNATINSGATAESYAIQHVSVALATDIDGDGTSSLTGELEEFSQTTQHWRGLSLTTDTCGQGTVLKSTNKGTVFLTKKFTDIPGGPNGKKKKKKKTKRRRRRKI